MSTLHAQIRHHLDAGTLTEFAHNLPEPTASEIATSRQLEVDLWKLDDEQLRTKWGFTNPVVISELRSLYAGFAEAS